MPPATAILLFLLFTNLSSHFVPLEAWQTDVEPDHVRLKCRRRFHRFHTIVGHVRFASAELEKHGKHAGGVPIVIDNQNAEPLAVGAGTAEREGPSEDELAWVFTTISATDTSGQRNFRHFRQAASRSAYRGFHNDGGEQNRSAHQTSVPNNQGSRDALGYGSDAGCAGERTPYEVSRKGDR